MRIRCGFQDGVDIAAARAAKLVGLETEGCMAAGWRTESGPHPEYADLYGATVIASAAYRERTFENVRSSAATWIIAEDFRSPGTRLTLSCCRRLGRPRLDIPITSGGIIAEPDRTQALGFLLLRQPSVLNIAGNRSRHLEEPVQEFLVQVFTDWRRLTA